MCCVNALLQAFAFPRITYNLFKDNFEETVLMLFYKLLLFHAGIRQHSLKHYACVNALLQAFAFPLIHKFKRRTIMFKCVNALLQAFAFPR